MISFVIPAYNEERYLGKTISAIHEAMKEIGARYEIVVADDASTDGTAVVAANCGARVVRVEKRQIAGTRNAGARAAHGDTLIFVDADTHVNAAVVRAARAALEQGFIGGGARVRFHGAAPRWAELMVVAVSATMQRMDLAAGCFVFCRRGDFEAVGGFDERHYAAEEIMLSRSLKRRGRFTVLDETVTTSPRKVESRSALQMLGLMARLTVRGFAGVRKREHTAFWYDGKR
jgi:glycosyltransferase involved in cell wall biosynthesis